MEPSLVDLGQIQEKVQSALLDAGYQQFSNEKLWLHAVRSHLGDSRFKRFEEQVDAVQKGLLEGRHLYDTLYQAKDFALVLSRDFNALVHVYTEVLSWIQASSVYTRDAQNGLLDLGCGIAPYHKILSELGLKPIGIDTSGNALMIAADLNPESAWMMWDFQKNPCAELTQVKLAMCVFGVDFQSLTGKAPEGINQFAPYLSGQSQYHLHRKEEAYLIWENWTPSFASGGLFLQVLRIAWFDHFAAWVSVAQENDWRIKSASWVETSEERFPMIEWEYEGEQEEWDIREMISFWEREI